MQVRVQMPGLTPAQTLSFIQPLVGKLNALGIPLVPSIPTTVVYSSQTGATGGGVGNGRFASRIYPRAAYTNPTLFAKSMAAARATVEDGYVFHGLNFAPTLKAAGNPSGNSLPGVNPVWRTAVMHADIFDPTNMANITPSEFAVVKARLDRHMDAIRGATPGGGAYFNEADGQEPDWQRAFFGANYNRLLGIKKRVDPWQVFWSPTTPGSEGWEVRDGTEIPTQNGRLCRVGA